MKKKGKEQADQYTYRTIDGREFIQRRLVLAQMEQLIEKLHDVKWPDFGNFNLVSFYEAIGTRLPVALAILLTEKDKNPRDKDLDLLTEDIRYGLPIDEGLRAFKDFFTLNPTASIAEEMRKLMGVQSAMKAAAATGSPTSS